MNRDQEQRFLEEVFGVRFTSSEKPPAFFDAGIPLPSDPRQPCACCGAVIDQGYICGPCHENHLLLP